MIDLLKFLRMALMAYSEAKNHSGIHYIGSLRNGVCNCCIFVAVGREAWRVSEFAQDVYEGRKG